MARTVRFFGVLAATLFLAFLLARSDIAPPAAQATFPGDNGRIVFVANDGTGDDLWTVNPDGSDKKALHAGVSGPRDPVFSSDGSKIAFWQEAGANSQMFIVDADGQNLKTLPENGGFPSWNKDGTDIVYRSTATGTSGFWILDVSGAAPPFQVLGDVNGFPPFGRPAWSPDGSTIAFNAFTRLDAHGDGIDDLYTIPAAGGAPQKLTNNDNESDGFNSPTWFADGTHLLVFQQNHGVETVAYPGGGITPLSINTFSNNSASSPDGTQVAYTAQDGHLHVAGIGGGSDKDVSNGAISGIGMDWGPSLGPKVEFVQATQELQSTSALENSVTANGSPPVPLVAGKPAVMRVYFPAVSQPTDYLVHTNLTNYGARNDDIAVHLEPGCNATQRRDQSSGCGSADKYFVPPAGQWTAVVSIGIVSQQQVLYSHDFTFTSQTTDPLTIVTVPVCDAQVSGNFWDCGDDSNFSPLAFLRSLAPTATVSVTRSPTFIYREAGADKTDWWYHVLLDMQALRAANPQPFPGKTVYVGIVRPDGPGGIDSVVRPGGFAGAMVNGTRTFGNPTTDVTLAQIVASAVGVHFTDKSIPQTSSAPGCDGTMFDAHTDWPFADNYIQLTGFDVLQGRASPGAATFDLMANCWPAWISEHSYMSFLKKLGGVAPPDAPAAVPSGGAWLVSGTIDGSTASFAPVETLDAATDTTSGQGDYRIEVRGNGNSVLFTRNFDAAAIVPKAAEGQQSAPGPAEFAETLPVQAGAQRIVVLQGNSELGAIDLTGAAPTVTFDSQPSVTGQQPVSWTITDPDSSAFTSWLDYSKDGGATWQEIASGLPTNELQVDFDALGGSANAMLRVRVSDGANTGEATSDAFAVPPKGPQARIVSPSHGAILRAGQIAALEADAFDADDGALTGDALHWTSSLDGDLGSGESLSLTSLSVGTHVITLTAHDSANNTASDHVSLTIWQADTIEGQPNGDVNCDKQVTVLDALLLVLAAAGTPASPPDGCAAIGSGSEPFGDANCDNSVTVADAIPVLRSVAGVPMPPPAGCRPVGA